MGITRLPAHMIRAKGAENASVLEVQNERLSATTPSDAVVSEIESGLFDATQGVLTLTFYNGTTMRIPGWPTADKIPAGPTGPQGLAGKDGKSGKDGRDGAAGAAGCAGPQGQIGQTGPKGETGRTGQQGPQGPTGPQGPEGLQGPVGPTGPQGPMGPQGPRGEQGPQGKPGPKGPEGFMNIVVSNTEPKEEDRVDGMLWVSPSADWSCDGYRPPECPECPDVQECPSWTLPATTVISKSGDTNIVSQKVYMGPNPGLVRIEFVSVTVPGQGGNAIWIYYKENLVANSNGMNGTNEKPEVFEFQYEPDAVDNSIRIDIRTPVVAGDGYRCTVFPPKL